MDSRFFICLISHELLSGISLVHNYGDFLLGNFYSPLFTVMKVKVKVKVTDDDQKIIYHDTLETVRIGFWMVVIRFTGSLPMSLDDWRVFITRMNFSISKYFQVGKYLFFEFMHLPLSSLSLMTIFRFQHKLN